MSVDDDAVASAMPGLVDAAAVNDQIGEFVAVVVLVLVGRARSCLCGLPLVQ